MRYGLVFLITTLLILAACGQGETQTQEENVTMLNNLGFRYASEGQTEKAKEYFNKALEINTAHETARKNLAMIHFRQKNFTAAAEHFRLLTKYYPENATYHFNLAVSLTERCRQYNDCSGINESIQALNKTLELNPNHRNARMNLEFLKNNRGNLTN